MLLLARGRLCPVCSCGFALEQFVHRLAQVVSRHISDGTGPELRIDATPPGSVGLIGAAAFRALNEKSARSVLCTCPSNSIAESLAAEAAVFLAADRIVFLPGYESIPYRYSSWSADIALDRMRALSRLLDGEQLLVFTSVDGLVRRLPALRYLLDNRIRLKPGLNLAPLELVERLVRMGYSRESRVEAPGQCALKGSVLDYFAPDAPWPVRLDYFDDEIEDLRTFDPESQMGRDVLKEALILPAGELVFDANQSAGLIAELNSYAPELQRPRWARPGEDVDRHALSQFHSPGLGELFPLVMESAALVDYFVEPPLELRFPLEAVESAIEHLYDDFARSFERESLQRITVPPEKLLLGPEHLEAPGQTRPPRLLLSEGIKLPEKPESTEEPMQAVRNAWGIQAPKQFGGRIAEIRERIGELAAAGNAVVISSPYSAQIRRIAGMLATQKELRLRTIDDDRDEPVSVQPGEVLILRAPLRSGFILEEPPLRVITDAEFFGRQYRRRSRFKRVGSAPIESFLDLKEGDHVVHITHGVGRFVALEKVRAAGRERDFLVLEYAEADRLYVPLDQISMVQRYVAPTENPRLDSLGKASFKKVRERVQKKIEEFAGELVRLYALRMSRKGYGFPPDTQWQDQFEADFPFEETPDQISAIEAVKADMEADRPMDRLVCGDVGYGKTEVAIRAAFKAVMAGKQVAIVAPTTILALQHYKNISARFQDYPISVDWISRFRTRGAVREIKGRLLRGELDVIIGTHALLGNDLHIRNLGLLIIDEEQRFGVTHKEAIKKMKALVDVITLSATPIPRTLHMSLVGIRDLSIIQTPPVDRRPVHTYVMEDNESVVAEAIRRELDRGGQVFYLHNRIESIEAVAESVRELIPDASIAVLHGKLPEEDVEDTLLRFMEQRFDILITTAIIENGIDMPNVNTLIVDRADAFGLSQLYQIRGRVGRSGRQAYAYFLYKPGRVLTETAQKRLNTLLEYQDLGSGFRVAMRDLEIRGAGNILGREQSGSIIEVGYEMYVKLLEDAVHRLRGEAVVSDIRPLVSLNTDFLLPEEYIPDTRQRIEFYKRFEGARDEEEVVELAREMEDRFGHPPESARIFVAVEVVRAQAAQIGFESVQQDEKGAVLLTAGDALRVPGQTIIALLQRTPELSVHPGAPNRLRLAPSGQDSEEMLAILSRVLREILPAVPETPTLTASSRRS